MAQSKLPRFLTENFFTVGVYVGTAQVTFLAFLLVLQGFGIISILPEYARWISLWTAANLLSVPTLRRRVMSPKIANPKCNHCGSEAMAPTGLVCTNCGAPVGAPKNIRDLIKPE